jgi:hypothetical protein
VHCLLRCASLSLALSLSSSHTAPSSIKLQLAHHDKSLLASLGGKLGTDGGALSGGRAGELRAACCPECNMTRICAAAFADGPDGPDARKLLHCALARVLLEIDRGMHRDAGGRRAREREGRGVLVVRRLCAQRAPVFDIASHLPPLAPTAGMPSAAPGTTTSPASAPAGVWPSSDVSIAEGRLAICQAVECHDWQRGIPVVAPPRQGFHGQKASEARGPTLEVARCGCRAAATPATGFRRRAGQRGPCRKRGTRG